MANSKTEHVVIRNNKLFCSNCGDSQAIPFPIAIPVLTAMGEAFTKMHKDCKKTCQEPTPDEKMSTTAKAYMWLNHGERGMSSECMYQTISGQHIGARSYHPSDPDDFRRCYGLLKMVPEWKDELHKMKKVSAVWSNLVDNWDRLTEMLEEQLQTRKANGMYEFMKKLGC